MRFAISIPQSARQSHFDAGGFRAHLRRIEELGHFESAWVQEQVIGAAGALAPLETLTYAAACTETLRLGCAVFVLPLHNPLHLAKAISSLDCLSHGRVEVGVVTGGKGRPFAAFGVDAERPVARFNEALALMKACWTEPRVDFDGEFWTLRGAAMEPKPVQRPHPPVWFGGSAPAGMRRAVRHGDGFMGAGSQTPAVFADLVTIVREELAAQGRDPATFRIGKRVYIHVDDDEARGRERLGGALTRHYGGGDWSEHLLAGPAGVCAAGIRAIADSGAELILLNSMLDEAEQLERLATEVIPAL
jgi:probable F420-dependent oxidoreductase